MRSRPPVLGVRRRVANAPRRVALSAMRHRVRPTFVRFAALALAAMLVASVALAQQPAPHATGAQPGYTAPPAVVTGRILGPDKKPMEEVEVLLGGHIRTLTDKKGNFEFDPVDDGDHEVLVRRVGFAPVRFRVTVKTGDIWDGTIYMQAAAQSLPEVIVIEPGKVLKNFRPRWIDGFVERRRMGAGTFLDRLEIEKLHALSTARLLTVSPGVYTRQGMGFDEVTVNRCGRGANSKGVIFVDGIKMEESGSGRFQVLQDYPPENLQAVEIFKGHSATPPQYDDPATCFVVLLWTTRR